MGEAALGWTFPGTGSGQEALESTCPARELGHARLFPADGPLYLAFPSLNF